MQARRFAFLVTLACGLLPALAQTPVPTSPSSIDPSLLAKASTGDATAQVQVGEAYAEGKEVPRDYQQAAAWYRKAADQNDLNGERHLAALYRDGGDKHFPRDIVQAATWYRKAADQGDVSAQGTLGLLYAMGQGVPRSEVDAYFWLDLAASVPGPKQAQYAANRQMIGTHLTTDDLDTIHEREAQWKAAHPHY